MLESRKELRDKLGQSSSTQICFDIINFTVKDATIIFNLKLNFSDNTVPANKKKKVITLPK